MILTLDDTMYSLIEIKETQIKLAFVFIPKIITPHKS
jgi:hypothetical protein